MVKAAAPWTRLLGVLAWYCLAAMCARYERISATFHWGNYCAERPLSQTSSR